MNFRFILTISLTEKKNQVDPTHDAVDCENKTLTENQKSSYISVGVVTDVTCDKNLL